MLLKHFGIQGFKSSFFSALLSKKTMSGDEMLPINDYPIHKAVKSGDDTKVKKEMTEHPNHINTLNQYNFSPLMLSSKLGLLHISKQLVESGADLNQKGGKFGDTSLHLAAQNGNAEVLAYLLECGADLTLKNNKGITPLHMAVLKGHIDIIQSLIDDNNKIKFDVHVKESKFENSPLHLAVQFGKMALLLKCGADVNMKNSTGSTPLHNVAENGHTNIFQSLIDLGGDINIVNKANRTVFHVAALNGHLDIVKLLIAKGASPNEKGYKMLTPLHEAAMKGHVQIVKYLLENGANVNSIDIDGDTPLHLAVRNDNLSIETTKVLLDYGADFKKKNKDHKSPLEESRFLAGNDVLNIIIDKISAMKLQETDITPPKPFQFTLDECLICTKPREEIIALLPCGHAKTCEFCSLKLIALSDTNSVCPICRSIITDYKKIYV